MPRQRATATKDVYTAVVAGVGEISEENLTALLDDFLDTKPTDVVLWLPLTADGWSPAVQSTVAYTDQYKEVVYKAITDGSTKRGMKGAIDGAVETEKVSDVVAALVKVAKDSGGDMLFAWNEDDDFTYNLLEAALAEDIACFNLLDGVSPLTWDEGGADGAADDQGGDDVDLEGVTREGASDWAVRKLRAFALDEKRGSKKLTSDQTSEMDKAQLLDHFWPVDGDENTGAPEPDEAPAEEKTSGRGRRSRPSQEDIKESAERVLDNLAARREGGSGDEAQAEVFLPNPEGWVSDSEALVSLKTLQAYLAQGGKNPPGRPRKDGVPSGTTRRGRGRSSSDE